MEPQLRSLLAPDWIIGILFLSLLLLVVAKERFGYRFSVFINLISNNKYVIVFNKKQGFIHPFQLIWQVFAVTNTSLFIYLNTNHIGEVLQNPALKQLSFTQIFLIVLAFVSTKQIAQLLHGLFFDSLKKIKEFLFKKNSYFNYASLGFFISNITFIFILPSNKTLFLGSLMLVITFTFIGWLIVLKNGQKYITEQFLYFILYLCTLEIAPFILIGSLLKN